MVASTEFVTAADTQADALGFDAARVFVPHPIQDRTDEEMDEIARSALEEIVSKLTRTPSNRPGGTGSS